MHKVPRTPIVKFGSHIPVLIKVMSLTNGPVLEMGMGFNSSLVLHWMCAVKKRPLVSYENDPDCFEWPLRAGRFANEFHQVKLINDWNQADIEKPWDVALIDHVPALRRKEDAKRLAKYAQYLVLHDTEGRLENHHHYQEIYPLFRWKYDYNDYIPKTSVLSNFIDLSHFSLDL